MRSVLIVAVAIACPLSAACDMGATQLVASGKREHRATPQRQVNLKSSIADRQELWEWDSTRLKDGGMLTAIQRLGANEAFVLDGEGILFKTIDGSETWSEVPIPLPGVSDDAGLYDVTSFHFVNSSDGWATVTRTPEDVLDAGGFESWILQTTDGGASWVVRYSDKAVQLTRVSFVSEQEGWVVGGRLVKDETQHYETVVMRTTDKGNYWADVSHDLNPHAAGGYADGLYVKEPANALLMGPGRKFYSTVTGGQDWRMVGQLTGVADQVVIQQLGLRGDGRPWALGGTRGREGTWMMFALQNGDNSWTVYRSDEVFLEDAAFLSDKEVIACGSMLTDNTPRLEGGGRDGVILHSADAGLNWSVVYRNPNLKEINALSVVNSNNIWAVGEDGLVIRLKSRLKDPNSL